MKSGRLSRIGLAAVLLVAMSATMAHARGAYMGVQVGPNMMEDLHVGSVNSSYETGYGLIGTGGYDFGTFRVEGELGYRQNGLDRAVGIITNSGTGDLSVTSLMANIYYDAKNSTPFTPYIGGGLGFAYISFNDVDAPGVLRIDGDDTELAFQAGAGVTYRLDKHFSVDVAYRLFVTTDIQFTNQYGTVSEDNYLSNSIMAGIRYNF